MSAFTLDTSGAVHGVVASDGDLCAVLWPDLTPFAQGYVEAMFTSLPGRWNDGQPTIRVGLQLVQRVGFSDLAPETLAAIRKDCADWQLAVRGLIANTEGWGRSFYDQRQTGWKMWPTRDFGDRFPPLTVSLGDDGKVYAK